MSRFMGHHKEWDELTASLGQVPVDDLISHAPVLSIGERADCCTAPAMFSAVLPVTVAAQHPRSLLLCAHHFRAHRAALKRSGADVYDQDGVLVA